MAIAGEQHFLPRPAVDQGSGKKRILPRGMALLFHPDRLLLWAHRALYYEIGHGTPSLLHLIVRSDSEPRRIGLASAKSVASWWTRGGTSEGVEVAMTYLTAIRAVRRGKLGPPAKTAFWWSIPPATSSFAAKAPFQMIPHARRGAIAGLLELLNDHGGRDDLYRIAEELRMEVDDSLPIVEAATLLKVMSRLRPKARHLPKSIFLLVFAVLRRN